MLSSLFGESWVSRHFIWYTCNYLLRSDTNECNFSHSLIFINHLFNSIQDVTSSVCALLVRARTHTYMSCQRTAFNAIQLEAHPLGRQCRERCTQPLLTQTVSMRISFFFFFFRGIIVPYYVWTWSIETLPCSQLTVDTFLLLICFWMSSVRLPLLHVHTLEIV